MKHTRSIGAVAVRETAPAIAPHMSLLPACHQLVARRSITWKESSADGRACVDTSFLSFVTLLVSILIQARVDQSQLQQLASSLTHWVGGRSHRSTAVTAYVYVAMWVGAPEPSSGESTHTRRSRRSSCLLSYQILGLLM